LPHQM
jgi:hypothetical protein